jgi:integrase
MKLMDLAVEYANLNIFNSHTRAALLTRVKVFSERSDVVKVSDVNFDSIARFKTLTLETSVAVTYNSYIRYLRILFDYALERKLVKNNWFREIRVAPEGVPPVKTMDKKTIALICSHIRTHPDSFHPDFFWLTVVATFFYTGMRRRQLVSLRVGDILFDEKTIILSYEGSKTKRSWSIPLNDDLSARLRDLIVSSQVAIGRKLFSSDRLFVVSRFNKRYVPTAQGGMKAECITGFFKRLSQSMGSSVGAHRFRHTFASELCNPEDDSSPDIFAVQSMLGHTSIQTTRGYVRTSITRMESTIKRLSSPF